MKTGQLFYEWLATQAQRSDPIGDLAKDVVNDPNAKPLRNYLSDWVRYLRAKGALPAAIAALTQAWSEYQRAQPRPARIKRW
jgi:uncharacterized protein YozE (UPF0346 family)